MKRIISFAIVIAILTSFIGCNESVKIEEDAVDYNCLTDNNVTKVSEMQSDLLNAFEDNFKTNKSVNELDITNATVLQYSNSDLIGIVVSYKNNKNKSFITYYDNKNKKFTEGFNLDIVENGGVRTLIFSDEYDTPELELVINSETSKIIDVNRLNYSKKISWSGCMEIAYTSCMDDWECNIMCSLTYPACVSAMAIACLAVT